MSLFGKVHGLGRIARSPVKQAFVCAPGGGLPNNDWQVRLMAAWSWRSTVSVALCRYRTGGVALLKKPTCATSAVTARRAIETVCTDFYSGPQLTILDARGGSPQASAVGAATVRHHFQGGA